MIVRIAASQWMLELDRFATQTFAFVILLLSAVPAKAAEVRVRLFSGSKEVAEAVAQQAQGSFALYVNDRCEVRLDLYGITENGNEIGLACSSTCAGSIQIGEQTTVALSKKGNFAYECGAKLRIRGHVK